MINEMKGKGQHHEQEHVSFSPAPDPRIAQLCVLLLCPQARATQRKAQRARPSSPGIRTQPGLQRLELLGVLCTVILARPFISCITAGEFLQLPGLKPSQYQIGGFG